MKKFLSLMLAMIMVMSLVVVGAGAADFTDAAEITNTEAVEVMNALGILQGSDGAFDPTGTLTRGAAAKIVTYMLQGTAKAEAIAAAGLTEKPFSDVPTTSATAPFIAYCAEKGIVGGYSDGTFQRSNPVSGNAFVKMVLVALGVTDIDFTAKGWQVEAISRAEEMGLLEGVAEDVLYSANLTRENAAQIAFNGMKYVPDGDKYWVVGDVEFDNATDAAVYAMLVEGTAELKTDLTKSLAGKNYKLAVIEEYVIESTPETVYDQDYTVASKYSDSAYDVTLDTSVSKDLVGHVVNIYYQDADADGVYDYSAVEGESEKVYGIVVLSDEVKVSSTKNGLKYTEVNALLGTDLTKTEGQAIYNGADYKTEYSVVNYEVTDTQATAVLKKVAPTYDGLRVNSGTWIIYDESIIAKKSTSNTVDVYEVTVDEDGYVNVEKGGDPVYVTAEDEDDCVGYIVNEMDWASLVEDYDEPTEVALTTTYVGDFMTVAVPATVTGKVTSIDISGSTYYIYIDGVKYQGNTGVSSAAVGYVAENKFAWDADFRAAVEYTFYLDASKKVFAYERADGVTEGTLIVPTMLFTKVDYVANVYDEYNQIDDEALSSYSFWLQAVDMNGEIVTLQVEPSAEIAYAVSEDTLRLTANTALGEYAISYTLGQYATYTTSVDETTEEEIATVSAAAAAGTADEVAGWGTVTAAGEAALDASSKKVVDAGGYTYYLTDGFKTIYIDGTGSDMEIVVKTGSYSQIVEGAMLYGEKADEDDAYYVLKYVLVADDIGGEAGEDLIYVKSGLNKNVSATYIDEDGKAQIGYNNTVYINGEKVTILVTGTEAAAISAAGFYTYEVTEDGTYDLTLASASKYDYVVNAELTGNYKGLISVEGVADYDATDAVIVNLLSSSSDYGYDDVPTKASKLVVDGTTKVSFIYDTDAETISVIYVTAYADQD